MAQDDFENMENLPKSLRTRLVEEATLGTLSIAVEQVSPCSAGNSQPRAPQCIVSAAPFSFCRPGLYELFSTPIYLSFSTAASRR